MIDRLRRRRVPTDPVEHRAQHGAAIGLKRRTFRPIPLQVVNPGQGADDLLHNGAVVVADQPLDEIEERGRRGAAGLHQRPGVADEIGPVGRHKTVDRSGQSIAASY